MKINMGYYVYISSYIMLPLMRLIWLDNKSQLISSGIPLGSGDSIRGVPSCYHTLYASILFFSCYEMNLPRNSWAMAPEIYVRTADESIHNWYASEVVLLAKKHITTHAHPITVLCKAHSTSGASVLMQHYTVQASHDNNVPSLWPMAT